MTTFAEQSHYWQGVARRLDAAPTPVAVRNIRDGINRDMRQRARVPTDTGRLKRSLVSSGSAEQQFRVVNKGGSWAVEFGSKVPYLRYQKRNIRLPKVYRHTQLAINAYVFHL